MFSQFLHVRADEHLAQLDEIAVLLIVNFNYTPRVRATPDGAPIARVDFAVRAYDGEGDLGCDFLIFSDRLFIIIIVLWRLEDTDLVVRDIREDLAGG